MKKIYSNILAACTALFVAAACTANIEPAEPADPTVPADGGEYQEIVVTAVNTKTIMNDDGSGNYSVDWCQGDAISVFATNLAGQNHKLSSSNTGKTHETKFEGQIEKGTTGVVALYPYNSAATYSEGVLTTEIPVSQTATVSSFGNGAAVTMAKGTVDGRYVSVPLEFHHLCSVIEFTLPDNITNVTSITVTSKDNNMTGEISVDYEKEEITSASSASVVLTGNTITGGHDYCVTIAPGNYKTSGFLFTIATPNGSFVREATGVEAVKGKLYKLGVLSYAADENAADVTASIVTTYGRDEANQINIVTGSDATLTLTSNVPADFSGAITKWTLKNVKFYQGGTDFRSTASVDVTSGTAQKIDVISGKPYMPKTDIGGATYSWTADIYYTVNNGTKTVERFLKTATGTVDAPGPDGEKFEILMDFEGYTNLSIAKDMDNWSVDFPGITTKDARIALANDESRVNKTTVYNVGGKSYKSGLSADVYAQCASLLAFGTTQYDRTDVSGEKVSYPEQTWATHTISCPASFDGVSPDKQPEKPVHITGMPYNINKNSIYTFKDKGDFIFTSGHVGEGAYRWQDNQLQLRDKQEVTYKGFYIPEGMSVDAIAMYSMKSYVATEFRYITTQFTAGETWILNEELHGSGKWHTYSGEKDAVFTNSHNTFWIESNSESSSWAVNKTYIDYVGIKYN